MLRELEWGGRRPHDYNLSRLAAVEHSCLESRTPASAFTGTVTWDAMTQSAVNVSVTLSWGAYGQQGPGWQSWCNSYVGYATNLANASDSESSAVTSDLAGATDTSIDITQSYASGANMLTQVTSLNNLGAVAMSDPGDSVQVAGVGVDMANMGRGFTSTAKDPATTPAEALTNAKTLSARNKVIAGELKSMGQDIENSSQIWGEIKLVYYYWGGGSYRSLCQEAADNLSRLNDLATRFPAVVVKH